MEKEKEEKKRRKGGNESGGKGQVPYKKRIVSIFEKGKL